MQWKTAFRYLPINYNTTIGTIENITQRTFIQNNLNGERIRIKFSNRYSKEPLILDKVVIAQQKKGSEDIIFPVVITYQGRERIEIGAGEEFMSDEMEFHITAKMLLVVSMYVKEKTNIQSACSNWSAKSWNTVYGVNGDDTLTANFTTKEGYEIFPYVNADVNKANIMFGITEIQIETKEEVSTICLFGDSITHMSYFQDALAKKHIMITQVK